MNRFTEVESIEHDYVQGERQSRRTLQIVLRRPIEEGKIKIGMRIRLHTSNSPNTIIPDDKYFKVDDIHGRILLVTPVSDIDLLSDSGIRLVNINEHHSGNKYIYQNRNIVYGNGLHHYRFGRSMYTPRPNYHNSKRTYISIS